MDMEMRMPGIIRENNSGFFRYAIEDVMFEKREIQCVGEITHGMVHSLILQLRYLQQDDPQGEITMYIDSPGGAVSGGLALYDVMQAVRCPVRTVCMGRAASMAALLFVAGTKGRREILPHARIMVHDPLIAGGIGGSALSVDAVAKDLMKTREVAASILAGHTGHTMEEVYAKTATDTYFDAGEAVAWGMADRIIYEI